MSEPPILPPGPPAAPVSDVPGKPPGSPAPRSVDTGATATDATKAAVSPSAVRTVIALLALLLAVIAVGLSWRAQERVKALEQELVKRQQDSQQLSAEARLLSQQTQEGLRESAAKLALLEARLSEVAVQRGQLEELIQSMSRSRDENVVVDIEASLRVAQQQGAISGSAEPLVAALRKADERLSRYNEPRLEGVRRAIGRDLDRVRKVALADIGTLVLRLDEAVRLIDDLPLLAAPELPARSAADAAQAAAQRDQAASAAAEETAPEGWKAFADVAIWRRAVEGFWSEVRSLVRVTRIDQPEGMLVAPEQIFFLRENLKLRLLNARLALLSRQFDIVQSDLKTALGVMDRYHDGRSRRTQQVRELLRQVVAQARQGTVPRPDDTLAALAAAAAGR